MRLLTILFAAMLICLASVSGYASVVKFDDLPTPEDQSGQIWGPVPSSYSGLTWTNFEVANGLNYATVYGNSSANRYVSANNFAYNKSGVFSVSTSGSRFDFLGAYFSSWYQNNAPKAFSSTSVTVTGYNAGVAKQSITFALDGTFKKSGAIYGVDTLVFKSNTPAGGTWWRMDDFEFRPVPEPTSLAAFASLSLTGIGIAAWKRRRQK